MLQFSFELKEKELPSVVCCQLAPIATASVRKSTLGDQCFNDGGRDANVKIEIQFNIISIEKLKNNKIMSD